MSFSSILADARNFTRNNFTTVLITLVILSLVTELISQVLLPSLDSISQLKSIIEQTVTQYGELTADTLSKVILALSEPEKAQLIAVAMSYLFKAGLVFFLTNLIVMSILLALIATISYQQFSLQNLLKSATKIAPHIGLFMLLAIPGFIVLSIIASILAPLAAPLGMVAVVIYISLYVIFMAVIIEPTPQYHFFAKFKIAVRFFKRDIRLILPMLGLWLLGSFLLNSVANSIMVDNFIIDLCFNIAKFLLTFVTVCYLYRLYLLSSKVLPYDTRN
ncbi:uncharacterized protein UPF0259 [Orbus hercynius]|uniref:Uncharacterized protein UPF0259 n=1 Tax=Orbus hercynius TaxID=593135 RepID=A0A495RCQ2_9GAMM|nr:uncharacterized protein UPF0259 [Orbus hercynius]